MSEEFISLLSTSSKRRRPWENPSTPEQIKKKFTPNHMERNYVTPKVNRNQEAEPATPSWLLGVSLESGVTGLGQEVEALASHISPSPDQFLSRKDIVARVKTIVSSLWPASKLLCIGSSKTGLCLPSSDLDLVICGRWSCTPLTTLQREVGEKGIAVHGSIKVIRASTPIVTWKDVVTGLNVDVSFNLVDGVVAAEMTKGMCLTFPSLRPLVMLIKQLVLSRGLGVVYTGGISSYSITMLVISFLQTHPREQNEKQECLGVLLLEFLDMYGRQFNYNTVGVSVRRGGYVDKAALQGNGQNRWTGWNSSPGQVSIESLVEEGKDVSTASYNMSKVSLLFSWAHHRLTRGITLGSFSLLPLVVGADL